MMYYSVMEILMFIWQNLYKQVLNTITTIIAKPWAWPSPEQILCWITKILWTKVPTKVKQKVTSVINQSTQYGGKRRLKIQEHLVFAKWHPSLCENVALWKQECPSLICSSTTSGPSVWDCQLNLICTTWPHMSVRASRQICKEAEKGKHFTCASMKHCFEKIVLLTASPYRGYCPSHFTVRKLRPRDIHLTLIKKPGFNPRSKWEPVACVNPVRLSKHPRQNEG